MKNSPLFWLSVLAGAVLLISNTFFIVDKREHALMFQFSEIRGSGYTPGLKIKIPFVQSVRKFDARMLTLDNQTESFLTSERKNVEVDFFVRWRIDDPTAYYRATGGQELVAMDRLAATVNRGLRDQFAKRTIQEAITSGRNEITAALEEGAVTKVKELGVEIMDVRIKSINLPKEVSESVYDRMRAERTKVAADLRARGAEEAEKIRAEADRSAAVTLADAYRESEELRGEGDAKAAEIYAKAYGQDTEFYSFYRSLGIYRDSFSDRSNVLVLEPKGEFFKYFKGSAKK